MTNPLQAHFEKATDDTRLLFNELVERIAASSNQRFDEVYRDMEQMLNSMAQYTIEEEP